MNLSRSLDQLKKSLVIEVSRDGIPRETNSRTNLLSYPWLRPFFVNAWPLFGLRALTLAGFLFTIAAGLFGSRVGSHNFGIIFAWIAWWTALKLLFIPFGGRSWCSVCPIPLPGEWLQRGGIFQRGKGIGLNLRWPKRLRSSWLQSGAFLLIGLFSALTLTDPRVTGWLFLGLFLLAIGLSLVYKGRAFCTYACPIGGFTGLYAQAAPIELRVLDKSICASHEEKTCYQNCPWGVYPVAFRDNSACGLCMECLRSCPKDNLGLNVRPFGTDFVQPKPSARLDDVFLALVMLGSALAFSAVFTGPWGWLKSAAYAIGSPAWIGYALGFLGLTIFLLPGLYVAAVWVGERLPGEGMKLRQGIIHHSRVLLPLGLAAWIAFTISFALPKINTVLSVLSDPFGWGWNLLGTTGSAWSPDVSGFSPLLQAIVLMVGLGWSASVGGRNGRGGSGQFAKAGPVLIFCLGFTLVMLWLLVG